MWTMDDDKKMGMTTNERKFFHVGKKVKPKPARNAEARTVTQSVKTAEPRSLLVVTSKHIQSWIWIC